MRALLICPAARPAVPHLAGPGPLAAAPALGGSVVSHWVEHLAGLGTRDIRVVAADRAEAVAALVGDGARWGVKAEVMAVASEPSPEEAAARYSGSASAQRDAEPAEIFVLSHLPGADALPLFESYAAWFQALRGWLARPASPIRVRVNEVQPGIWVHRRAWVSPRAQLIAPCWIGDQVCVQPGAIVGPDAIVEDRSVVEAEARVAHSWVGPDTFVGTLTAITRSLAWGSQLINWQTDSSLHVPDPFLLCSLTHPAAAPLLDRFGRALAKAGSAGHPRLDWTGAWRTAPEAGGKFTLPGPATDR